MGSMSIRQSERLIFCSLLSLLVGDYTAYAMNSYNLQSSTSNTTTKKPIEFIANNFDSKLSMISLKKISQRKEAFTAECVQIYFEQRSIW